MTGKPKMKSRQGLPSAVVKKLVIGAGKSLSGDWVLVGGALLLYLGASERVTEDIDLVPAGEMANSDQLKLFGLAEELGLPVEAVNSAAGFFLKKIKGYRSALELLHEGPGARIFRPNATLYLRLKIPRMSESDLADCMAMLRWVRSDDDGQWRGELHIAEIRAAIASEMKSAKGTPRGARLEELRLALAGKPLSG